MTTKKEIRKSRELCELRQKQALPLDIKVEMAKSRIREWVNYFGLDACAVSVSGGKDSTVLLHIAREVYPDIKAVFFDTGLEMPEVRRFALSLKNVDVVRPKRTFRQVIDKCGYPIISKEIADRIYRLRNYNLSEEARNRILYGVMPDGSKTRFKLSDKWRYLLDAPFEIGNGCCSELKKKPAKAYAKKTGRYAQIVGTMAEESALRTQVWLRQGCNAYDNKDKKSAPLSFFTEADIWEYIRTRGLKYSAVYDMDYARSGCFACCFGVQFDGVPNRFQRLQKTHPKLWAYCMKPKPNGGLGLKEVLEYIGIPYENINETERAEKPVSLL
jgi:3'-phosphoadenosine 5'-phosphosulfate sulfotransferase (PAPS reductase)/FAD synthetase